MSLTAGEYRDAFKGTAYYYSRFRQGYPQALLDLVAAEFALDGRGRLLDLGCGTGQIAVPFAPWFAEVVAMDPEPEMLAEAQRVIGDSGARNIRLVQGSSAGLSHLRESFGIFRVVTMGNSFHWMDREATLQTLSHMVEPGGGVVVAGASSGGSFWTADEPWCRTVKAVIQKWLGKERRAGSGTYSVAPERHEEIIDRSPFAPCRIHTLPHRRELTVDQVIGTLYSTSFCSPAILGDRREGFEADLRRALLALDPAGRYTESVQYEILLGSQAT